MVKKDFDIRNLNPIYESNDPTVYDDRNMPFSIFNSEPTSNYSLDRTINYGKDYLDSNENLDLFHILTLLKKGNSFEECFEYVILKSTINDTVIKDRLISDGFVKKIDDSQKVDVKSIIMEMDAPQLSHLLKKHGVNASGKKKKLVKLALKSIPEYEFNSNNYKISEKGLNYLKEFEWIELYEKALIEFFEFNEFCKYKYEHDKDLISLTIDYITEHEQKADLTENFKYCDDCYTAKSNAYAWRENDLKSALNTAIKRFIFRINPKYPSYMPDYEFKYIFDYENIEAIQKYSDDLNEVKKMFYENWESMNLKKEYIPSSVAYEYLEKLLNGEDLEELSEEVYIAYFKTIEELFNVAKYYYYNEDYGHSISCLDEILEELPNSKHVLYCKALNYISLRNSSEAMKIIDNALEIDENIGRLWSLKGVCYDLTSKNSEAEKCFEKAIELSPDDVAVCFDCGIYYDLNNEPKKALKYLDKAEELTDNIAPILYEIEIYDSLHDEEKVEELFEKAHEINGNSLEYLLQRGFYNMVKSRNEEAMHYIDKCLEINEELSSIWFAKALLYAKLEDELHFEECIKIVEELGYCITPDIKKLISKEYFKRFE